MPVAGPPQEFQVDDLNDVVDELATGIYAVTRSVASTYVNGVYDGPASTSSFNIKGVVWPATGVALQRLAEGLRTHETKSLVTKDQLLVGTTTNEPDKVNIEGVDWQVQNVSRWAPNGNFFEALLQRVSEL